MNVITATTTTEEMGPLTQLVLRYSEMIEQIVSGGEVSSADWEPLKEFIATDEFKRVGAYLEEMTWDEYVSFLNQWAGSTRFEVTVFQITEIGNRVFQEIEERHYRGDEFIRKNVIAVYIFNEDSRIRHLDIYEQARNSGQWIQEAARKSTEN